MVLNLIGVLIADDAAVVEVRGREEVELHVRVRRSPNLQRRSSVFVVWSPTEMQKMEETLVLTKPPASRWLEAPSPVWLKNQVRPVRIMLCGNRHEERLYSVIG